MRGLRTGVVWFGGVRKGEVGEGGSVEGGGRLRRCGRGRWNPLYQSTLLSEIRRGGGVLCIPMGRHFSSFPESSNCKEDPGGEMVR